VRAGSEASALNVLGPTKLSESGVRTGDTKYPWSMSCRSNRTDLYAATPPVTPRTMRAGVDLGVEVAVKEGVELIGVRRGELGLGGSLLLAQGFELLGAQTLEDELALG